MVNSPSHGIFSCVVWLTVLCWLFWVVEGIGGRRRGTSGVDKPLPITLHLTTNTHNNKGPTVGREEVGWGWKGGGGCVCVEGLGEFLSYPPLLPSHLQPLDQQEPTHDYPRYPSSCNLETLTMERFFNGDQEIVGWFHSVLWWSFCSLTGKFRPA